MDPEVFGKFIKQCRYDLCISQSELAEKLHVTAKAVSRWERGVGFPDIKLLQPLADALEITIVELMQSKRIVADIPKEEAADLLSGTVDSLRQQEKLAWNRLWITFCGSMSIFMPMMLLVLVSRVHPIEPKWVEFAVYETGVLGAILGARALQRVALPARWCRGWRCILLCGGCLAGAGLLFYAVSQLLQRVFWLEMVFLLFLTVMAAFANTLAARLLGFSSNINFGE